MQLSLDAATATRAYPHTLSVADEALLRLGERLRDHDYRFTTTTPLTHSRVLHRGSVIGTPLMRVFGWSLPFSASDLPADVLHDLAEAKALARHGGLLRSKAGGVTEVARRVGYGSASAFSTAFTRHTGVPPARYALAAP